ncbi:MFS transporter [Oceanobacillus indicireducens]|uniref:Major facilitator superfamily (MFS) profile domain-containing protein n=1 Tax=Oceanobacillus indicireducens TaxID=1004261 RepID=A0A917Y053_9BACI|nr:MFS transporter [Oceanobacillus indicireducens]GGN59124.1 hypothetical protein GCM10007971_21910 [Oceanobacillus indicireducens]
MVLLLFVNFCIFFIESQIESSLAQHIELTQGNGIEVIGVMLSIGTILILTLQPFVGYVIKQFNETTGFMMGGILFSTGPILFLFTSFSSMFWYIGMIVLTLGELILGPKLQTLTVELSDENNRGTYFSITGIGSNLAYFLGPVIGSFLISNSSIIILLSAMTIIGLFGTLLLVNVSKRKKHHTQFRNEQIESH